jgi:hypothetical protein
MYRQEYQRKLTTPEQAVAAIPSGATLSPRPCCRPWPTGSGRTICETSRSFPS